MHFKELQLNLGKPKELIQKKSGTVLTISYH